MLCLDIKCTFLQKHTILFNNACYKDNSIDTFNPLNEDKKCLKFGVKKKLK